MKDSELEEQLRALRPVAPSPALERRVAQGLADDPRFARAGVLAPKRAASPWHWWRDLGWAAAGAAAALSIAAFFSPSGTALPQAARTAAPSLEESAFEPAGATSELLAADDTAQLFETSDGPVREVRYSFRERHAWTNPRTGARMEIEVPREDVYLLPVSLQ